MVKGDSMEIFEAGHTKKEGVQYVFRECCYGIAEKDGKLMLVYSDKDKNYSVPGGGIEKGEDLEVALKREFLEETGYIVTKAEHFIDVHSSGRNSKDVYVEQFSHIFKVEVDESSKIVPLENWHTPGYYTKEEVKNLVKSYWQTRFFEEILKL